MYSAYIDEHQASFSSSHILSGIRHCLHSAVFMQLIWFVFSSVQRIRNYIFTILYSNYIQDSILSLSLGSTPGFGQKTNQQPHITAVCEQGLNASVYITRKDKIVHTIFYVQYFHKSLWFIFTALIVQCFFVSHTDIQTIAFFMNRIPHNLSDPSG